MAGDEIGAIGAKPEAERKDEEKARLIQLQNLDLYVQEARTALSDARRHAQGLAGELARASTEQALDALKRAREQLDDPIAVLRAVAADELALVEQVDRLGSYQGGPSMMDARSPAGPVPASIAGPVLAARQAVLTSRLDEVIARLKAGLASGADADPAKAAAPPDRRPRRCSRRPPRRCPRSTPRTARSRGRATRCLPRRCRRRSRPSARAWSRSPARSSSSRICAT